MDNALEGSVAVPVPEVNPDWMAVGGTIGILSKVLA
jgi:hypothetical protein